MSTLTTFDDPNSQLYILLLDEILSENKVTNRQANDILKTMIHNLDQSRGGFGPTDLEVMIKKVCQTFNLVLSDKVQKSISNVFPG